MATFVLRTRQTDAADPVLHVLPRLAPADRTDLFGTITGGSLANWQFVLIRSPALTARYIFLIWGVVTMGCALAALLIILPDFPTSDRGNRHLSKAELELVRRRLAFDRACSDRGRADQQVMAWSRSA